MITLGAVKSPLDESFTIPGFGIVISVKSLMESLCAAANLDQELCNLIGKSPERACKALVDKGDNWLKQKVHQAFDQLIAKVLEGVDCQHKNWKEMVVDAFDISFSDNGISIEIDTNAILQNIICAVAAKAISVAFDGPVNKAVRALKNACAKMAASSSSTSSTSSNSQTTPALPPAVRIVTKPPTAAQLKENTAALNDALKAAMARGDKATIAILKKNPFSQPTSTNNNVKKFAWIGGGLVLTSTIVWLFLRKKSRY